MLRGPKVAYWHQLIMAVLVPSDLRSSLLHITLHIQFYCQDLKNDYV